MEDCWVGFGVWAAGGLGGRDVSESQGNGMMMSISLVLRENELSESVSETSSSSSSSPRLVTERLWRIDISV